MSAMPCGADAYRDMYTGESRPAYACCYCRNHRLGSPSGKCLGTDGYRFMALVASEVAAERGEQVERILLWREHTLPVESPW